jgi:hypothetical protein
LYLLPHNNELLLYIQDDAVLDYHEHRLANASETFTTEIQIWIDSKSRLGSCFGCHGHRWRTMRYLAVSRRWLAKCVSDIDIDIHDLDFKFGSLNRARLVPPGLTGHCASSRLVPAVSWLSRVQTAKPDPAGTIIPASRIHLSWPGNFTAVWYVATTVLE